MLDKFLKHKKKISDFTRYYPLLFTFIFVFLLFQYSFSKLEGIFYDLRVRYDANSVFDDDFILIYQDEESDDFLGEQYPYTYASHERLIKRLIQDEPQIINYFIRFDDPKSDSELASMKGFKNSLISFAKSTKGIVRFGTDMDIETEYLPPKSLQSIGYSLAIINVDGNSFAADGVARKALLNISGDDSLHLWTANKYRQYHQQSQLDINSIRGSFYIQEADATYAYYKYFSSLDNERSQIRKIPFHRVVVGNFPKGFFKDKIVLIGPSYISRPTSDFVMTPFNKDDSKASKLAVHATIIKSLINGNTLISLPIEVSFAFSIVIAILLSYVIFKFDPTKGLLITLLLGIMLVFLSFALFSFFGLWLQMTHLLLTVLVVYYIWVPFKAIGEYQRRFAIQEESKIIKRVEGLKRNFISLMSHDLKTPVAKIAGIADITLQQNKNNVPLVGNLKLIIDSTKELNKFITSILDLTKVESQKLNLQMVSKDINPVIENIVEELRYEANEKEIQFELDLGPLYPIRMDVNLMKRVVSNLVENAIKYSGAKSVVRIQTWDDMDWTYLEISDNGHGIPEEDVPYIFEKFYRAQTDATRSVKGTGLGLYLVKYFVELQGGEISVSSTIGKGTNFQIKLKNT